MIQSQINTQIKETMECRKRERETRRGREREWTNDTLNNCINRQIIKQIQETEEGRRENKETITDFTNCNL